MEFSLEVDSKIIHICARNVCMGKGTCYESLMTWVILGTHIEVA